MVGLLLNWKIFAVLTILSLALSYFFSDFRVYQAIGDYTFLSIPLSYVGVAFLVLTIITFGIAWYRNDIRFPSFLNRKIVISSIPILIVTYMLVSLFLYEEFVAFQTSSFLLFPFALIDGFLFFLVLFASIPFKPLLDPLGLWAHDIISGPNEIGLYVVALFYSVMVYIIWSFIEWTLKKWYHLKYG